MSMKNSSDTIGNRTRDIKACGAVSQPTALPRFSNVVCLFVCFWRDGPQWARASSFTRFLYHTRRRTTVGSTPLDEWSARRKDLYLTTHNTHNRQTTMPLVGFEPTSSPGERLQTYVSDRAATGTGKTLSRILKTKQKSLIALRSIKRYCFKVKTVLFYFRLCFDLLNKFLPLNFATRRVYSSPITHRHDKYISRPCHCLHCYFQIFSSESGWKIYSIYGRPV